MVIRSILQPVQIGLLVIHTLMTVNSETIRSCVQAHRPRLPDIPPELLARLRPAAVLVPLFERDDTWHVLLTRRTDTVEEHKGQVALPGGAREPGDPDAVATALRETYEELGIPPDAVTVLGELSPQPVISGFLVTPVVGIIPEDLQIWPAPQEIARVFSVPLTWLADPARVRQEYRHWAGMNYPIYVYEPYDGEVIWGLTARILRELLWVVGLVREDSPPLPPS